jgi:cytochrome P450
MYTAVPGTFPRLVPPGGAMIHGQYVPENTIVGIPHYAAFRSSDNFSNPDQFLPER